MKPSSAEEILRDLLNQVGETCKSVSATGPSGDYNDLLRVLSEIVSKLRSMGDRRIPAVAIPFQPSDDISTDPPEDIDIYIDNEEGVTYYLLDEEDFLIPAHEEYRKALPAPDGLKAVYRSWRDAESASLGWEFNNYVFVWAPPPHVN